MNKTILYTIFYIIYDTWFSHSTLPFLNEVDDTLYNELFRLLFIYFAFSVHNYRIIDHVDVIFCVDKIFISQSDRLYSGLLIIGLFINLCIVLVIVSIIMRTLFSKQK